MNDWIYRYRQDPFLAATNEMNPLDQGLEALSVAVRQTWQRIAEEAAQRLALGSQRLAAVDRKISDWRDQIPVLLGPSTGIPDPESTLQVARGLEGQFNWMYREVRQEVESVLEALARERDSVQTMFEELDRAYAGGVETLPEQITRLSRSDGQPVPEGLCIIDLEADRLQDAVRPSPWPLVSRWRQGAYHRSVRRRYRVYRPRLRDLAENCLQRAGRLEPASFLERYDAAGLTAQTQFEAVWDRLRSSFFQSIADLEDLSRTSQPVSMGSVEAATEAARHRITEAIEGANGQFTQLGLPYVAVLEQVNAVVSKDLDNNLECVRLAVFAPAAPPRRTRRWQRWLHEHIAVPVGIARRSVVNRAQHLNQVPGSLKGVAGRLVSLLRAASSPASTSQEALHAVTELPSPADLEVKLAEFPPVYRRLFSLRPLEVKELLIGFDQQLQQMVEAYQGFLAGAPVGLAVTGAKGSGKTSLLNCFVEEMTPDIPVRRYVLERRLRTESDLIQSFESCFGFDEPVVTLEMLISNLRRLPRQIVIVEGGHNLYFRDVGARRAVAAFPQVMLSTRTNLLWCVSFQRLPWLQMDHVLQISRYFSHEIEVGIADHETLRNVLLLRLARSGLEPTFVTDDPASAIDTSPTPAGVADQQLQEGQEENQESYFRDLFQISGGNLASALYFWNLSCELVAGSKQIRVSPCVSLNHRILQSLERSHLFTVAELVKHGGLTLKEHADLFNTDPRSSKLILDYLGQFALVNSLQREAGSAGTIYEVSPIYIQHTSAYLTSLNILH